MTTRVWHPIRADYPPTLLPDGAVIVLIGSWLRWQDTDGEIHEEPFADVVYDPPAPAAPA